VACGRGGIRRGSWWFRDGNDEIQSGEELTINAAIAAGAESNTSRSSQRAPGARCRDVARLPRFSVAGEAAEQGLRQKCCGVRVHELPEERANLPIAGRSGPARISAPSPVVSIIHTSVDETSTVLFIDEVQDGRMAGRKGKKRKGLQKVRKRLQEVRVQRESFLFFNPAIRQVLKWPMNIVEASVRSESTNLSIFAKARDAVTGDRCSPSGL